jgi:hypothetical protein
MRLFILILIAGATLSLSAQSKRPVYTIVEVDRFIEEPGVSFPPDYRMGLVEDVVRELKRACRTIEIMREGEELPKGTPVLRIAGKITEFKPGSRAKRYLIGFGAGSTVVKAHVTLTDAASGEVVLESDVKGVTWIGIAGGSSEGAGDHLAKKVADLAVANHLIEKKK